MGEAMLATSYLPLPENLERMNYAKGQPVFYIFISVLYVAISQISNTGQYWSLILTRPVSQPMLLSFFPRDISRI